MIKVELIYSHIQHWKCFSQQGTNERFCVTVKIVGVVEWNGGHGRHSAVTTFVQVERKCSLYSRRTLPSMPALVNTQQCTIA